MSIVFERASQAASAVSALSRRSINDAILELGTNKWKLRINQAKSRIKENFNINNIVKSYRKVWNEIR